MPPTDQPPAGVLDALPVGVLVLGPDGRVLGWNAAAEELTGWTRAAVLGRDLADSTTLDRPTAERILAQARSGAPFAGRLPASPPSGRSVYFRCASGPGGTVVAVLQDVADTRAEDEAFGLLDALWETAPIGLAYFDTQLRYRRVNGTVLASHGGTRADRLGRTLEEVHGTIGIELTRLLGEVLDTGRSRLDVPLDGRLWHGTGDPREWRLYVYPVRLRGDIVGVGLMIADVTAAESNRRQLAAVAAERSHVLDRYQSLVEATSAAVWTRAPDGSAAVDAPALRAITGQTVEQMRGWGWLDAVHPAHRTGLAAGWRAAVLADPAVTFARSYRMRTADGGYRWFRTRGVPVHAGGRVVEWVGTETDVDDAMRARDRLDVLAGAALALRAAQDPEDELAALADAVVPAFADFCRFYLIDPAPLRRSGPVTGRRSVTRCGPGMTMPPVSDQRFVAGVDHPVARCVATAAPLLVDVATTTDATWIGGARNARWGEAKGATSLLVAPVVVRGDVTAVLMLIACGDRPPYTEDDLALVAELGERVSAAVDAAESFRRNRQVAVALQSAMLTDPPQHPGVEVEGRYLPADAGVSVGGDWYDAFALPGGDLAVGVGDVVGHDLVAAAAMGQLRSMLRGLAHDTGEAPSAVVTRLDRVVRGLGVTRFATLIYGRVSRAGGRTVFRWSNAGHPPPVLVEDGRPRVLGGVDLVLGVDPERARHDREVELPPGSTLLLHTDGLVERRGDVADEAVARLLGAVREARDLPLAAFCDELVRGSGADTGDDIAVLALRPT